MTINYQKIGIRFDLPLSLSAQGFTFGVPLLCATLLESVSLDTNMGTRYHNYGGSHMRFEV